MVIHGNTQWVLHSFGPFSLWVRRRLKGERGRRRFARRGGKIYADGTLLAGRTATTTSSGKNAVRKSSLSLYTVHTTAAAAATLTTSTAAI